MGLPRRFFLLRDVCSLPEFFQMARIDIPVGEDTTIAFSLSGRCSTPASFFYGGTLWLAYYNNETAASCCGALPFELSSNGRRRKLMQTGSDDRRQTRKGKKRVPTWMITAA